MLHRTKWLLIAALIALAGNQIAIANPPTVPSEITTLVSSKLPSLWHYVLCLAAGRYNQAIDICNELLCGNPNDQRVYALRGYVHLFMRNIVDPENWTTS